jgi:hypothetical protein
MTQNRIVEIKQSAKPLKLVDKIDVCVIEELFDRYFWVKSKQELIFCIKNDIIVPPICDLTTCNNSILFSEKNRKYNIGCCKIHTQMINTRVKSSVESLKMTSESIFKRKETFLNRYGVDNPMKLDEFKNSQQISVFKSFGVKSPILNQDIQNKIKNTNIDKYGVDNPMKSLVIKNRLKQTNLENFGVTCCFLHESIQLKKQKTCEERFGVKFPLQSDFFLDKVKQTKIEKYGVAYPFQSTEIQQKIAKINSENGKSKKERSIVDILECEFQTSNRTILDGKELDIYIPSKKIAIEFNGIYWHSERNGKHKDYHLNKTEACEKKGIQLIHIFENEYDDNYEIVKSIILAKIGFFDKRIFARNCIVKELTSKEKNEFLEENHLQGQEKSSIKLGLFYNDDLVSVMTFGISHYNKKYEWELYRFCNKLNYQIIGGASKLFAYFIRNYKPKSVITYVDRRYFNGNFYEKIGFTKIGKTKPSYFYFKGSTKLLSKIQFKKYKLKSTLNFFDASLSEWENMQSHGYDRIWDCGAFVYEYKTKNV